MKKRRLFSMYSICLSLGAASSSSEPPRGEPLRTGALAIGGDGHVTNLCGFALPLPYSFTGVSGSGCEGVCVSSWGNGSCTDPFDSASRVDVYGCPQKTSASGYSCDGDHNNGTLIGTYSAGEQISISDF
jgi:hypothetical protein